jgi:hypothetical protein
MRAALIEYVQLGTPTPIPAWSSAWHAGRQIGTRLPSVSGPRPRRDSVAGPPKCPGRRQPAFDPHGDWVRYQFATVAGSPGVRRVWQQASPDLPGRDRAVLLRLDRAAMPYGQRPWDLAREQVGRPGMWPRRSWALAGPVAGHRADRGGLLDRCRPAGDSPGGRLVLTNWQPRSPAEARLPSRLRIDWTQTLQSAGFAEVRVESRPSGMSRSPGCSRSPWSSVTQVTTSDSPRCRTRHQALPQADLVDRVVGTATRPDRRLSSGAIGL